MSYDLTFAGQLELLPFRIFRFLSGLGLTFPQIQICPDAETAFSGPEYSTSGSSSRLPPSNFVSFLVSESSWPEVSNIICKGSKPY